MMRSRRAEAGRGRTQPRRYSRTGKLKSGQQTGSKRPASRIGVDTPAPKKRERPLKGTRRPGAQKKTAPKK